MRAALLLRINTLCLGVSGVREVTLDGLVAMLNDDVYPFVPQQGSVGASGDLAPLSHLALAAVPPIPRGDICRAARAPRSRARSRVRAARTSSPSPGRPKASRPGRARGLAGLQPGRAAREGRTRAQQRHDLHGGRCSRSALTTPRSRCASPSWLCDEPRGAPGPAGIARPADPCRRGRSRISASARRASRRTCEAAKLLALEFNSAAFGAALHELERASRHAVAGGLREPLVALLARAAAFVARDPASARLGAELSAATRVRRADQIDELRMHVAPLVREARWLAHLAEDARQAALAAALERAAQRFRAVVPLAAHPGRLLAPLLPDRRRDGVACARAGGGGGRLRDELRERQSAALPARSEHASRDHRGGAGRDGRRQLCGVAPHRPRRLCRRRGGQPPRPAPRPPPTRSRARSPPRATSSSAASRTSSTRTTRVACPAFLVRGGGLDSGFMLAQYTAAALVAENKVLCHPASVDSVPTCARTPRITSAWG